MEGITPIDNEISKQLMRLDKMVDENLFNEICVFQLCKAKERIPWSEISYAGVYRIDMRMKDNYGAFRRWSEKFEIQWKNHKTMGKSIPRLIKSRINFHGELKEWIPIYIGKSKNISKRVNEHIFGDSGHTDHSIPEHVDQSFSFT